MEVRDSYKVSLKWGESQTAFGNVLGSTGESQSNKSVEVDLCNGAAQLNPISKRELVANQLVTGHMRLDLGNPLTQGNIIFLRGSHNTGKTSLAMSAIKQFGRESPDNRAIYVGLT